MRAAAIQTLFCLCALLGAQANVHADPDNRFKLTDAAREEVWLKVSGEVKIVAGESIALKAVKGTVALIRANPQKVKNTDWYSLAATMESGDANAPCAGLVFGYEDEKNYCAFVVRGKSAAVLQVKGGVEQLVFTDVLKEAPGPKCRIQAEIRIDGIASLRVNDEVLYPRTFTKDSDETKTNKLFTTWKIAKGGIGLICESGECSFKDADAQGIAKR